LLQVYDVVLLYAITLSVDASYCRVPCHRYRDASCVGRELAALVHVMKKWTGHVSLFKGRGLRKAAQADTTSLWRCKDRHIHTLKHPTHTAPQLKRTQLSFANANRNAFATFTSQMMEKTMTKVKVTGTMPLPYCPDT